MDIFIFIKLIAIPVYLLVAGSRQGEAWRRAEDETAVINRACISVSGNHLITAINPRPGPLSIRHDGTVDGN